MLPITGVWGTWLAIAVSVVWLGWSFVAPAADDFLMGPATVIDADTLEIRGKRVRLHGVDAPETKQNCYIQKQEWPCGRHATLELANWLRDGTVFCRRRAPDSYGRMVATCYRGVRDIGAWLTSRGWAVASTKYSRSYVDEQRDAQRQRKGIWQADFVMPWNWRDGERVQ